MDISHLVFLEVEPEDTAEIQKTFPGAQIASKILTPAEIISTYAEAEILCTFIYSKVIREVIENLPHLQLIVTRSVGYDHIDLKAAAERNIAVCNVPDYGAHVIAEHVFALLLASVRCVKEGDERVEKCFFDFHGLRGVALKGKTLGIVGTGKIGQNVARIAALGFLMNVIAYDPYPDADAAAEYHFRYVSLEQIWQESDIITFHVPLLESTKHMVNTKTIAAMKDGVILINTARGGILDTKAVVTGVKSGKISHVAVDVLEHEQNIAEDAEFISLPRVITTPHIAFYADDSMRRMYTEAFQSIQEFLHGEKLKHQVVGI